MSTIDPDPTDADDHPADIRRNGIEIRRLETADEMRGIVALFQQVWGSPNEMVPIEMLMAISHAGGYVAGAFDVTGHDEGGRMLGASVALLARHQGQPALHSHITGVLQGAQSSGLGRAMKLHQQDWARGQGIGWIVWTFDPLVRRNAWFNIAVLGAEVHEYLPSFYGQMTDAMNQGDETDRLLVAWDVSIDVGATLHDGSNATDAIEIPTPDDIIALRRTDDAEAAEWRTRTRERFVEHLAAGRRVVGFTRDGSYVLVDA